MINMADVWTNIEVTDEGCWLRTGHVNPGGYSKVYWNGKHQAAHRNAWERANGKAIPEGWEVDHTCHTRSVQLGQCEEGVCRHRRCVNPDHLEAVPRSEHQDRYGRRGPKPEPNSPWMRRKSRKTRV